MIIEDEKLLRKMLIKKGKRRSHISHVQLAVFETDGKTNVILKIAS